ncbi:MAG: membrane-associated protease RseP (regulator of RpoE activity) [Cyclobacteriaceae bacterium]|jgi:membrane-associated protease RseP (regulator of RpoE activity)
MFKDKEQKTKVIQLVLFVLTLIATTLSGAELMTAKSLLFGVDTLSFDEFLSGTKYSIPFLAILTAHEFGHYFVAQYHKVKVTLPYYIPFWLGFISPFSIGTMGAVIRIKDIIESRKKYFDIGVAGPLAGVILAIPILIFGFGNLPGDEYIFNIHEDYTQYGSDYRDNVYSYEHMKKQQYPAYEVYVKQDSLSFIEEYGSIEGWQPEPFVVRGTSLTMGKPLIYTFFQNMIVTDQSQLPHDNELFHYPVLLACLLAFFFTSINLFPIGQLDGGHILYGLVGPERHKMASQALFLLLLYYSGLGIVNPFELTKTSSEMSLLYIPFLYFSLTKFTPAVKDRIMYTLIILSVQMGTNFIFPTAEGYAGWVLFAFVLGRVLGIYHPPILIDKPLDTKRKIVGWISLLVFILCFSPKPLVMEDVIYSKDDKSDTPTFLSTVKPSPYFTLIDTPNSLPRASSRSINSGEEINVLDSSPSGSKN